MSKKINILDDLTINKIAAGEVVERPSSVTKELVENSIDAGSTQIVIDIIDGGKKQIRITDNGSGILSSEVDKSFLRHATSKIEIGQDYIEKNQIDRSYAVMIGDTLHDKEVADVLGIDCILVSNGHQAYDVLNVFDNTVVRNIEELKKLIGGC